MRDVYLFLFCLPDMSSRLGCRSRGSWVGEQRPGTAARQVERLRPAKVTQPSLVPRGPLSVPPARRPLWNSILDGGDTEPALTRDAGCYSISRIYGRVRISTI